MKKCEDGKANRQKQIRSFKKAYAGLAGVLMAHADGINAHLSAIERHMEEFNRHMTWLKSQNE